MRQRLAVAMFFTGLACIVVAAYVTYGPVPALTTAGIALMLTAPLIGIMSS